MATELATAYINLVPSMSGVQGAIATQFAPAAKKAESEGKKSGKKFSGGFSSSMKDVAKTVGGLFVAQQVGKFASDSVRALGRIEKLNAQTASRIKATGGVANVSAGGVTKLADSLERTTSMEAETVQEGANLLLTFKNVRNETGKGSKIFDRATKSAVDLSYAGFGSVANTSKQLGKALNDPVKGISALSRSGVTFTEQQKDQIKTLVESGKTLDAQKIILGEVESQVGGAGKAFAKTTEGKAAQFGHQMGALGETIMSVALPALSSLLDKALKVAGWMQENPGAVKAMTIAMIGLGAAYAAFKVTLAAVTAAEKVAAAWRKRQVVTTYALTAAEKVAAAWRKRQVVTTYALTAAERVAEVLRKRHVVTTYALTAAERVAEIWRNRQVVTTYALAAANRVLNLVMKANPFVRIVTILTALGAALVVAYKRSDTFRGIVNKAWAVIKGGLSSAWAVVKPILQRIGAWIGKRGPAIFNAFKSAVGKSFGFIKASFRGWMATAKSVWAGVGKAVNAGKLVISRAFGAIRRGVAAVKNGFIAAKNGIAAAWDKLKGIVRRPIRASVEIVNKFLGAVDKIPGVKMPRIKGFAGGGYTGPGRKYQPAGVVHADEFVISKRSRKIFERQNPGLLDVINRTGSMHGYAAGGRVVPGRGNQHPRSQYPWATYAGDFPNPIGTPVRAWKDGVIALLRSLTVSYGKHIRMNHTDGSSSLVAHMSRFGKFKQGDKVKQGQVIGYVGSSGNSTGPHTHIETMKGAYKGGPGGGSIWDTIKGFASKMGGYVKKFTAMAPKSAFFGGGMKGMLKEIFGQVRSYVKDKLFDSGGLASGSGWLAKGTAQPERVLSPRQTSAFEAALARDFGQGGFNGRITITNWAEGTGYFEQIASDQVDSNSAFDARMNRLARV